ncbi:MAG: thioredoxin family protein, partial [Myxococcales bacterium]|nr:thioredoxin family protein [Myxococcales bacterium]
MPAASPPLPLGTVAPDFALPDVRTGASRRLDDLVGERGTIVFFTCNHCPYVKHVRAGVAAFAADYVPRGVALVGIAANDPDRYPDDAPEALAREADAAGWRFPILFDASQAVARAYHAACTPEFYVFDAGRRLVYHGRIDASRPGGAVPVTGDELRAAADAVV